MTKDDVKKLYPHVVGLKVTKCPCANDVALIGFLLNSKSNGKLMALLNVRSGILYFIIVMFNWQYMLNR